LWWQCSCFPHSPELFSQDGPTQFLHSLAHKLNPTASVKRSGKWIKVPARELVVGDIISLKQGDIIPADVKILTHPISVNESSISGEAKAVTHSVATAAFSGTEILSGHTLAIVTKTGKNSRSGKTVSLINKSSAPGQLQILLGKVIGYLAILDAILAIILIIVAIIRHENLINMLPFLAMLFIATIPIAMPSSFAVANSVEAKELSKHHILVSDLSGIQEAANLNLLLVDKTGTITANKPEVVRFYNLSHVNTRDAIQYAVSVTDRRNSSVIDLAILKYAKQQGIESLNKTNFQPFNPDIGYSEATINDKTMVKLGSLKRLSNIAHSPIKLPEKIDFSSGRTVAVMVNGKIIGIFILEDQPRPDSAAAIKKIQSRGVKVIMLTGDNQKTAAAVAQEVGLKGKVVSYSDLKNVQIDQLAGISDVIPENKLEMVKLMQKQGYIVGMTGDGVNDAAALKQASVGIAVKDAVDLAKTSAKMILMRDGLMPIIEILDSGHRVYQRMLTWTITKLSRSAELSMLLVFGYIIFHFMPLGLNAMILVAILNDLVTLVLGTDNTVITHKPESWNLFNLSKIAIVLAIGWTAVGFAILYYLNANNFSSGQISSALYCYLIFSAMLTILMTRTKKTFWLGKPSKAVATAIILNCIITITLSLTGWGITSISMKLILTIAFISVLTALILTVIRKI
jgi:P-type E1-E2 ATPase